GPPPSSISSFVDPPGGGDTDIAFDHSGRQYFTDLYALACMRVATTTDGGATVAQNVFPGGCAGVPGADRPWLAVFDPPGGVTASAYKGSFPDDPGQPGPVTIAGDLPGSPDTLFTVLSLDKGRNLHVAYAVNDPAKPGADQVFESVASAASGWRTWARPVQVSKAPSLVNV